MERKSISTLRDGDDKVHVAGGTNRGIVVNKRQLSHSGDIQEPAQLSLEFRVFLVNATTRKYTQEKRLLSYWFKEDFPLPLRASAAQDFFKKLVSPVDFPRGMTCMTHNTVQTTDHRTASQIMWASSRRS